MKIGRSDMKRKFLGWGCALVVGAITLGGCANGYKRFYSDQSLRFSDIGYERSAGAPQLISLSKDPWETIGQMWTEGYAVVGQAAFEGQRARANGALNQAKAVGAAYVAVSSEYQSTRSGSIPITTPTTTTAHSSGNVSGYAGRPYSGSYSGTTTVYGTQTTYVPYSVDHYNQAAIFFSPLQRRGTGLLVVEMSDSKKREVGTNRGVEVRAVRRGSPAYQADVLPGDVLLSVNGNSIDGLAAGTAAFRESFGSTAKVVLARGDQRITKDIVLPSGAW